MSQPRVSFEWHTIVDEAKVRQLVVLLFGRLSPASVVQHDATDIAQAPAGVAQIDRESE